MHEASLAAPLLRLVLEETGRHEQEQGRRLRATRIRIRAGLLMGVEAPVMQGIFALMAEGSAAENAELVVETEPMHGICPDCPPQDAHVMVSSRDFRCPRCKGEKVAWKGGNELYIASIAVQPEEA